MVGSELQLSNSLSLELKLLNETLQQQLSAQDRAAAEERQLRQFLALNEEIEKIKEEIGRIQKDHRLDLSEKSERIRSLEDDLRRSSERLELLQSEKEKARTDARFMQEELGEAKNELSQLRTKLSRSHRNSDTQTERLYAEDEGNLLRLTEQLEKSLADMEYMKATILTMQAEIEGLRRDSARLIE